MKAAQVSKDDNRFEELRASSVERLMRWPFNLPREEAERAADQEIAGMRSASDRFASMLKRVYQKPNN